MANKWPYCIALGLHDSLSHACSQIGLWHVNSIQRGNTTYHLWDGAQVRYKPFDSWQITSLEVKGLHNSSTNRLKTNHSDRPSHGNPRAHFPIRQIHDEKRNEELIRQLRNCPQKIVIQLFEELHNTHHRKAKACKLGFIIWREIDCLK